MRYILHTGFTKLRIVTLGLEGFIINHNAAEGAEVAPDEEVQSVVNCCSAELLY